MKDVTSRRWIGLVFISLAVALIIVDSTIVNVAIPAIVDDLGITSTQVQWVQEAYTLVFASLLLLFGSLADRIGRRRLLLIGVALFAGASVLASFAPTGDLLILARLIQGVGGAMMLPSTLSLLNATFQGRERGIAFAVWGSTIGGMAAVGPLLGGWLTTSFSWRWAFGINIPLGVIIAIGVLWAVGESRAKNAPTIDAIGAVLSVILFGALVFGLIEGRTLGWWEVNDPFTIGGWSWPFSVSPVPVAFAMALLAAVGFVTWSRRQAHRGRPTLLDPRLFSIATFRSGNIAALVVALGEFGIILSLPLWLQFVLGFDALQTGLILIALAAGSFVASGFAGASSGKISAVLIVRAGLVAEIVGVVAAGLVVGWDAGTQSAWLWLLPALFVYGFGVGLATAQLTGVILQDVPVELSGQGVGDAVDGPSGRIGAGHRDPRNRAVHRHRRHPVLIPRRSRTAGAGARSDRVGGGRQLGRGHRRPRCEPGDRADRRRREGGVLRRDTAVGVHRRRLPRGGTARDDSAGPRAATRRDRRGAAVRAELRIGGDSRIPDT